jgi:hypothetical protein
MGVGGGVVMIPIYDDFHLVSISMYSSGMSLAVLQVPVTFIAA